MSVYVFGNCTVDVFLRVDRLPQDGDTLLAASRDTDLGGKGANQAVMVGRCGIPAVFVGPLGDDDAGRAAFARLALEPIDLRFLTTVSVATDQSFIVVGENGCNFIVSTHDAAAALTPAHTAAALEEVSLGDLIVLQGNLSLETTAACLAASRNKGAVTLVNPAPIAFSYAELWPLVDYAIVNEVEAQQLGGSKDPASAGRNIIAAGAGTVLVTLGERGALVIEAGVETYIPAPKVAVVDTTGAGDVFCGVVAAGIARGVGLLDTVEVAIRAASSSVGRLGTQRSYPSEAEMGLLFSRQSR